MRFSLFFAFLFFYSVGGFAKCTTLTKPGTITFDVGRTDVPYNSAVGTVLKTVTASETGGVADGCSMTDTDSYARYMKGSATGKKYLGVNDIYSTNVPGIGFAICFRWCEAGRDTGWFPFVSNNKKLAGKHLDFGYTWYYVLIVIGPVSTGLLESGQYGELGVDSMAIVTANVNGGLIKSADCTLDSSNVQVNLGDHLVDDKGAIGYTFSSAGFDLGLTCDQQANISVTLEGINSNDVNDLSVLSLTNAGSEGVATGVGVQILYNDVPLKTGEPIELKITSGRIKEMFPFNVRYYQTKGEITPGEANATATLNITYQ